MLKARLVPATTAPGSFRLRFEVTNDGAETLNVLTWFTPLEGLWSDCIDVRHESGKRLRYDGKLAKRAAPGANDYLTLKPGETKSVDFDLHEAYDVSARPGAYRVKPAPPTLDYFAVGGALVHPMSALGKQEVKKAAEMEGTVLTVSAATPRQQTAGARVRHDEGQRPKTMMLSASLKKKAAALEPQFVGGDVGQQSRARLAHFDGYTLCGAALAGLAKGPRYTEWFGKYSAKRFKRVKANYTNIKKDMESKTFTYNLALAGCKAGVFAYTYKGTTTIWLCDAFWAAPQSGTDSKAGTVVHEHSHASADTDDVVYGQAGCHQLAIDDPDRAILNADTHEYYARG